LVAVRPATAIATEILGAPSTDEYPSTVFVLAEREQLGVVLHKRERRQDECFLEVWDADCLDVETTGLLVAI